MIRFSQKKSTHNYTLNKNIKCTHPILPRREREESCSSRFSPTFLPPSSFSSYLILSCTLQLVCHLGVNLGLCTFRVTTTCRLGMQGADRGSHVGRRCHDSFLFSHMLSSRTTKSTTHEHASHKKYWKGSFKVTQIHPKSGICRKHQSQLLCEIVSTLGHIASFEHMFSVALMN